MQHSADTNVSDILSGIGTIYAGEHICPPSHSYGPCARNYYLMHYILKGRGIFEIGGKTYSLGEGDIFFIRPEDITYYEADAETPWHYIWIGLSGVDAGSIFDTVSGKSPVMHVRNTAALTPLMQDFVSGIACRTAEERYARLGKLYMIISRLCADAPTPTYKPSGRTYVEEAVMYMHANIERRISVSALAKEISIDRSYLCSLFKKHLGISPQQYSIDLKMKSAANMLRHSDASVSDIAAAVGYEDALLFSRIFRARFGMSPRAYRTSTLPM